MIRDDAIDLFGHAPVERSQPGFNVGNRHVQLGRRQSTGES